MANKAVLQPIGKRVVVTADVVEEKTSGGLIVPPSANEDKKPASGTVAALGMVNDKEFKFTVKVGDKVYFKKYSPEEIEIDGTKYLVLEEEDILAIVK
ncbi:MAG: 10 kDa chaperonin [candidate division WS6 bacterium GW2011_GWF2_39_15]|uniref:Co-chaperonin GroES n=1 Tax=candidate division WS6 bacterium GW2011_GWF2_39_15 TaxID=1619100 RepID=A0A0G0MN88_9BACT|nr:MAG: 10 kDa chaperonin [candidate division WS6 bacterium GW2011_GWF2_39_15]